MGMFHIVLVLTCFRSGPILCIRWFPTIPRRRRAFGKNISGQGVSGSVTRPETLSFGTHQLSRHAFIRDLSLFLRKILLRTSS